MVGGSNKLLAQLKYPQLAHFVHQLLYITYCLKQYI